MGFGAASGCPWCILRCGAHCDACALAAEDAAGGSGTKDLGIVYGSERQEHRSSESGSSTSASSAAMKLQALLLSPCLSPEPTSQTADIVEHSYPPTRASSSFPPAEIRRRMSSSVRRSFSGRPRLASSAVSRTTSLQAQAALQETLAAVGPTGESEQGWREARCRTYTELSTFAEDSVILANGISSHVLQGRQGSLESTPSVSAPSSEAQGVIDLDGLEKSREFIRRQGWRVRDLGVRNTTEDGEMLLNQCFYLSIAHGYLGQESLNTTAAQLALKLRRAIETDVLAVHPEWAQGLQQSSAGECEPMVFADFLVISMHQEDLAQNRGTNLIARMAVCILDSEMGHCEVYLGPKYEDLPREQQEQGLVVLWYIPGHYQCLVNDDADGSKVRLTYEEFKAQMDANGIMYIETLE